jgi:tetratricopeptide (TPR) repeat protein
VPQLALHRRLAAYFEKLPLSLRRVDELPWQLQQAEEWERLRDTLADMPTFTLLTSEEKKYELRGYWILIEDRFDLVDTYQEALDRQESADQLEVRRSKLSPEAELKRRLENTLGVGQFFILSSKYEKAEVLLRTAVATAEHTGAGGLTEELRLALQLALKMQRRFDEAVKFDPIEVDEKPNGGADEPPQSYEEDVSYRLWMEDFRNPSERRSAILMYRMTLSGFGNLSVAFTNEVRRKLGRTLAAEGEFAEAEQVLRVALDADEREFGAEHAEVARDLLDLANLHTDKGELESAEACFRQALAIRECALGPTHAATAKVLNDFSLLLSARSRQEAAVVMCGRALRIAQEVFGPTNPTTQTCRRNLECLKAGAVGANELRRSPPDNVQIARMLGGSPPTSPGFMRSTRNFVPPPIAPNRRPHQHVAQFAREQQMFGLLESRTRRQDQSDPDESSLSGTTWPFESRTLRQDQGDSSRKQAIIVLVLLGLFHAAMLILIFAMWPKH